MAEQTTNSVQARSVRWSLLWGGIVLLLVVTATAAWYFHRWPWVTFLAGFGLLVLLLLSVRRLLALSAGWFWGGLFVFGFVFYLISLSYQAQTSTHDARYLAYATVPPDTPATPVLVIAYPPRLPLESREHPGWPLSVYLRQPVSAVTPTLTIPPPPLALPPPLTRTVTSTIVFLTNQDGLLFTDEKGVPVSPQLMVSLGRALPPPAVLYLRQAAVATAPETINVTVQSYDQAGTPNGRTTLAVDLEDEYEAWWRHLGGLILGPATPLLALAAALVGFGWQRWQDERNREQAELDEIGRVEVLEHQGKLDEAKTAFIEITAKYHQRPNLQNALSRLRNILCQNRLQQIETLVKEQKLTDATQVLTELPVYLPESKTFEAAVRDLEALLKSGTLPEIRQKLAAPDRYVSDLGLQDHLVNTLTLVYRTKIEQIEDQRKQDLLAEMRGIRRLAITSRNEARKQYQDLENKKKEEVSTDLELIASLEQTRVAVGVAPFERPALFPSESSRRDSPAVAAWLRAGDIGLKKNPFGPERAEAEPYLPQLFAEPPGWEQIKAPAPALIFGAPGNGRTAACLLLAYMCQREGFGPDQVHGLVKSFPVRLTMFIDPPFDRRHALWWTLTRAISQASLDFLAWNPQTWAPTPFHQQRALVRLFMMHQNYLGDPEPYLQGMGLAEEIAALLAADIQKIGRGLHPPRLTDEAELLAILAEARLNPFQQCYLLAEVPAFSSSVEEVSRYLARTWPVIQALANQKVYLKLFLPVSRKEFSEYHLPGRQNTVSLEWDKVTLGRMMYQRLKWAGAPSLGALFHPPRRSHPESLLLEAALKSEAPPRRLIWLGQALLDENIRLISERRRSGQEPARQDTAKLHWEALERVLKHTGEAGEM